jgi:carbon monoxide dehydrogenase subunit G
MELSGERLIPADVPTTWAALNDPSVLKDCIAGCESLERTGENSFLALVAVKVGPVSARFKGSLQMTDVEAPNAYTINFDGQGGVAGYGKGSARVRLLPEGASTRLSYSATAQVGGKMAQIGSRLIDAAAAKITDDFFTAFEGRLQPTVPVASDAIGPAALRSEAARPGASIRQLAFWGAALLIAAVAYFFLR